MINRIILTATVLFVLFCLIMPGTAAAMPAIRLDVDNQSPEQISLAFKILLLLTVLSLAPAILIMTTCFTRIVIVLAFVRNALGLQQMPPNQVLIGLALILTFLVMAPVFGTIYDEAIVPYQEGEIPEDEALQRGVEPLRDFMLRQTREEDLSLFVSFAEVDNPGDEDDLPTNVIIPAFIISELKTAFQIGFIIFIPFLVIDMIVASTLMSMGMLMLPPAMISLPFKILLFVLVDGWGLVTKSLLSSFN